MLQIHSIQCFCGFIFNPDICAFCELKEAFSTVWTWHGTSVYCAQGLIILTTVWRRYTCRWWYWYWYWYCVFHHFFLTITTPVVVCISFIPSTSLLVSVLKSVCPILELVKSTSFKHWHFRLIVASFCFPTNLCRESSELLSVLSHDHKLNPDNTSCHSYNCQTLHSFEKVCCKFSNYSFK